MALEDAWAVLKECAECKRKQGVIDYLLHHADINDMTTILKPDGSTMSPDITGEDFNTLTQPTIRRDPHYLQVLPQPWERED
mgnify:CR=1 FL=1|tara:strand:+ start:3813 stop:4058 length:246 start_codon:yes stop_codon:yes gene_type:complete